MKYLGLLLLLCVAVNLAFAGEEFGVYADRYTPTNHFIPSGYMGDHSDIRLDMVCKDNPHSGEHCIKVTLLDKVTNGAGWAGVYWQFPANNWGTRPAVFDLSGKGITKLTFWARGENGGERIDEFKMGGISGKYSDSGEMGIYSIELDKEWKQYTIDVTDVDLSSVIGGFCWVANIYVNPKGGLVFYLDDIKYE